MTFEQFKDKIFALAKAHGVEAQLSYSQNKNFQVRYQNGTMDQYTDAGKFKITLQLLKDGKLGMSYTETLDDPEKVFEDALSNIAIIDSEDVEYFYDGKGEYPKIEPYDGSFEKLSVKERLSYVEKAHEEIRKSSDIINDMAVYGQQMNEMRLANTLGLDLSYTNGGGFMYAMAVAKDVSPRSAVEFAIGRKPEAIDPILVGSKARDEALALVGSKSVKSGKYRVILRNDVFSDILGMLISMISAENAQKNLSPLKGKIGEKIGSDILTVKDLPYHPLSISCAPFDTQGVPTKEKTIIENGVFKTFLHNLKTAKKEGVEPTGNAMGTGIQPINLYVEPGNKSFDELLKSLDDGLVIIEVEGMHSGANPISGNFSLGAKAFRVEGGRITHGVEQITISGNFLEMLGNIEDIGNDIRAFMGIITPSVLISNLDIAGNA
ncbi:putative Zn-dependent protease-like protein [Fervidobacterium pennivorans DSM 9078]|uniref:Zn-dependent protease-like protein n=1 Tax=Fervidobacterium pennivorans (strain DSM 9078 / Ven5) TaxID=771875 RepID=H9UEL4_FERPD|nr:TldD/PmbA family protein [Fervidobacterium pennivorans]AFG35957.1 putative Zn-dependent protease-like protein [Fervidobacterium pennivorans DSM 9078]